MSEALDSLTVNWEEDGKLKVKELKKHVLSKGAWATVMFLYQDMDPKTGDYHEPKISIRRYKKRAEQYIPQSKFNISSEAQGKEIARIIHEWYPSKA
jgi:hypothetical protein